jgi:histidine decarboxylase
VKQGHTKKLEQTFKKLKKLKKTFLGYPCDAEFDYRPLYRFLEFPINNIGDPFEASTYRLQTKEYEREVLLFFARLYNIKDFWGYITNGGTEGNLHGIYVAREALGNVPVLFSEDTHYSIKKNVHILNMNHKIIKSQKHGEIDYNDFEKKIQTVAKKKNPKVIVVANIGTTMLGAIDNPTKLAKICRKYKVEYYIHADAALYGMVLPFISKKQFDFRTPISSIVVSGHKFIGSPIPCGIVLTRKKAIEKTQQYIEYINAHDSTLSGSRDAFTALILWYRIKNKGKSGFKKQVRYSNEIANYLVMKLKEINWPVYCQSYITVAFKRPSWKTVMKWELAVNENLGHVICLPHDTKKHIDAFVADLKKEMKKKTS